MTKPKRGDELLTGGSNGDGLNKELDRKLRAAFIAGVLFAKPDTRSEDRATIRAAKRGYDSWKRGRPWRERNE